MTANADLVGKVAIVTGAGSGIGYAIAQLFAQTGAAVAINFLGHGDDAQQLAREIEGRGGKAIAVEADVSSRESVDALVATTIETFGKLDVLVTTQASSSPRRCSRSTKPTGIARSPLT